MGTVRLDEVKKHFGDKVDITWKSFLLRTEPKTTNRDKFVAYTQGWQRMAEMEPRAAFNPWSSDTTNEPPSSSLPAQVAYKVVEANWPEAAVALHWALLAAYFTENRTISDWDVLADVVVGVGVDRSEFLALVAEQGDTMSALVINEHNSAIEHGVTAVPTVIINEVLPIPGAQDAESYINWIERILEPV